MDAKIINQDNTQNSGINVAKENLNEKKEKKKISTTTLVLATILTINLIFTLVIFNKYQSINQAISNQEGKISDINATVTNFESKITEAVGSKNRTENILRDHGKKIMWLSLSHEMADGVVTDQFFVNKATFYEDMLLIDIDTQPVYSANYEGLGNFSVDDRELKKCLLELVNDVEEVYSSKADPNLEDFNELRVLLTIKNYTIGGYIDGEIKLLGE